MKIFVINLEKDVDRRDSIKKQLDKLNLPYEIIPGVYGKNLSADELTIDYNAKKAHRIHCRNLSLSEIGCALSHINLYKKIIEEQVSEALILEDDVILPNELPNLLQKIEEHIHHNVPEVILLSPGKAKYKHKARRILTDCYSIYPYHNGYFTSSYIINQLAAISLSKELYPVHTVADCWIRLKQFKVIDLCITNKAVIEQDQDTHGSSTTTDINLILKKDVKSVIVYKLCRVRGMIQYSLYALYKRIAHPYNDVLKKQ